MALKKVKSNVVNLFSSEDYGKLAEEYSVISEQIKELDERKKHLSELLKDGAEKCGVKDDKGSYYCDTEKFIFGRVAKKSVKLNEERAQEYLKSHNKSDMIEEIITYKVNEQKLEDAVKSGEIKQKDFESLCDVNTSYSVTVNKKEEMAEVEQSTLKVASRKK